MHAGRELALEVHDVERDAELRRDAPGVVGRVRGAAALLELASTLSATSWSRIQTPTTSWPCSWSSAAATELSTPPDIATRIRLIPRPPAWRRAARPRPRRAAGRATAGTTRAASSISAVVVERPRLMRSDAARLVRRVAHRASARG